MKSLPILAGLCLLVPIVHAQERTAGSSLETQMTWSALSNQIKGVRTQLTAVDTRVTKVKDDLGKVDDRLTKLEYCSRKGLAYAPTATGHDAQGCLKVTSTTDPDVARLLTCSAKATFYTPSHAKADTNGCIAPNIVDTSNVKAIGGGCKGLGCTAVIDMTPYLSFPDVSVQATCSGAWCITNDLKPVTSSAKLSTLSASWDGLWVAGRSEGSKHSYIQASYNISTKKLTLKTAYSGDGTGYNLNDTKISDIKILYVSRKLALPSAK